VGSWYVTPPWVTLGMQDPWEPQDPRGRHLYSMMEDPSHLVMNPTQVETTVQRVALYLTQV
jgi:hypothetical protein